MCKEFFSLHIVRFLKGQCHAIFKKKLNLFSYQLNSKNNSPVLLFKTIILFDLPY